MGKGGEEAATALALPMAAPAEPRAAMAASAGAQLSAQRETSPGVSGGGASTASTTCGASGSGGGGGGAPRASRLTGWRDALAAPKRKADEAGGAVGGGVAGRAVRPKQEPPLPAFALLRDACRLDLAPHGESAEEGWAQFGPRAPPAHAATVAAAAAAAAGATPTTPLPTACAPDGQPLDDALWGVAPRATPQEATEPETEAEFVPSDPSGEDGASTCLDGGADADNEADVPHGALTVPLLRHQRRALAWMSRREAGGAPVGGLLADDQGLGKTLTTIALVVSRRPPPRPAVRASALPAGAAVAGGTLVVCPTSVLRQWGRELRARVSHAAALSVLLYHGPARARSAADVARYDVVLTTYAIVTQELAAAKPSSADEAAGGAAGAPGAPACAGVLGQLTWWRVVLDEAQSIKNARSQVAAAVWALRARRRWCLSGTPLQNSVDDLFSYFRFLRYAPYDELAAFRCRVREPIRAAPAVGFASLQRVLARVMLRRTKATRIGGEPIVRLPPRSVALHSVDFSAAERACYGRLQAEYRDRFAEFRAAGTVSTNYVNILYMLLRLRQACNHLGLAAAGGAGGAGGRAPAAADVAAARRLPERQRAALLAAAEASRAECPLCADLPEEPVVALCGALFCKACWAQHAAGAGDKAAPSAAVAAAQAAAAAAQAEAAAAAGAPAPAAATSADDGRDPCPACGAAHGAGDAHSAAALRAAAPKGAAAAAAAAEPAAPPLLPTPFDADLAAAAGLEASCKLRAVLAYLCELRTRMGGIAPLRGGGGAKKGGAAAGGGKKDRAVVQRDKGEQLRAGIKSSDAALAAALPPLPPVAFSALRSAGAAAAAGLAAPPEKVIIFSQWTGMLNLLEPALRDEGFAFRRLDGTMSLAAREKALHEFESRADVRVMLMSLKAAGLGVNLVCANHVLLLDCWWNPTVEEQAIDRAHRIGQTREVHVARFTVRGTVEDRILALQEHKRALAAAAFGEARRGAHEAACAAGGAERSKLTVEDLLFLFADQAAPPAADGAEAAAAGACA